MFNPLWIGVTLSITLTVCSNISHYIEMKFADKIDFNYDYETVLPSFAIVFGSGLGVPLILFCFLLCAGLKCSLENFSKVLTP